jgi:RimJ/RimL family protein N-acetyltransferase
LKAIKASRASNAVTLEDLGAQHFDLVAQWLSRPEINRWLTRQWRDKKTSASMIAIAVRDRSNRLFMVRHGGNPCGLVGLADIDAEDGTAMVWYVLGEEKLSGRGITSRAVSELARVAFGELGLMSLYAWVMEDNFPSQKVLRKVGFLEAGRIRQSARSAGRLVDRIYFDLIPSEIGVRDEMPQKD